MPAPGMTVAPMLLTLPLPGRGAEPALRNLCAPTLLPFLFGGDGSVVMARVVGLLAVASNQMLHAEIGSYTDGERNLLLRALNKAGLKFTDIQPVYLSPADAANPLLARIVCLAQTVEIFHAAGGVDADLALAPEPRSLHARHRGVRSQSMFNDLKFAVISDLAQWLSTSEKLIFKRHHIVK